MRFRPFLIRLALSWVFLLGYAALPGAALAQDQDDGQASEGGGDQGEKGKEGDQGEKKEKQEGKEGKQGEGEKKAEEEPSYRDRIPPNEAARTIIKRPHTGPRPDVIDVHAGIGAYFFGLGGGARYTMNVMGNGFVPSINNAVGISFGADVLAHTPYKCDGWDVSLSLPVTMQWAFYLTRSWTVFAELGTTFWIHPMGRCGGIISDYFDMWFIFGPGAIWNITESSHMIFRLTYPYFQVGYAFDL